jgi:N-methylhydantoinase B
LNDSPADPSGLTFAQPGDALTFSSAGGGGYGSPLERDIEAVAQDVLNGYVSLEGARRDYGVVMTADGRVDHAATRALRQTAATDSSGLRDEMEIQ